VDRLSWDRYFIEITKLVAKRSTCLRRSVGAILVKERRILATGYNGAPRGLPHCTEIGCLREKLKIPSAERQEICRGIHAEQNAIVQAAYFGISVRGSTLYCTHKPCITCAKLLINAGVKRIVYTVDYPDEFADGILHEAGIEMVYMPDES